MTPDGWDEYRDAVTGLSRLPAGFARRHAEIDRAAHAPVEEAERRSDTARRAAAEWRRLADDKEAVVAQHGADVTAAGEVSALRLPVAPVELVGELLRLEDRIRDGVLAIESAQRAERRRRATAAPAANADAARSTADGPARPARDAAVRRLALVGVALVIVLVLVLVLSL